MKKISNNMKIYIFILFIFTESVTNGLFLESSGTLLDSTQLATSTMDPQSPTFSKTLESLHPTSSISSSLHEAVHKTHSTIPMKNTFKLTASKTESLQNSRSKTQKKESTVMATKISTEPITMTTVAGDATSTQIVSLSIPILIPTSIQPTSSSDMNKHSSNSPKTDVSKSFSISSLATTSIQSTFATYSDKSSTVLNSTSTSMKKTMLHQPIQSTIVTGLLNSSKTQSRGILVLTSVKPRHSSSTAQVLFHPTKSSEFPRSTTDFQSSISVEPMSKIMENSDIIMKSSISQKSIQTKDSSLSAVQSNQNSFTTPQILASPALETSINILSSLEQSAELSSTQNATVAATQSHSPLPSKTELSRNFDLLTPSPTIKIPNTKWESTDTTVSVHPSSLVFGNGSIALSQPLATFSADLTKMYSYASIELSSALTTIGDIAPTISASLSSKNISDTQLPTFSSEIPQTIFPSSTMPTFWPIGGETLSLSRTRNQTSAILTVSASHQPNETFAPTSAIPNNTEAFLIPTIYIKPTRSSSTSKIFTPHSKTTVTPPSSSEKSQNISTSKIVTTHSKMTVGPPSSREKSRKHPTMSNDLPTNPTTTRIIHTTETMYYPTHKKLQKYNATIELTFNGQCRPLRNRRIYEHFVDNVQSLISKRLRIGREHVIVHNLTCASVHIHVTFLNIMISNLTGHLQDLIDQNKMMVTVYGDRQELHYAGTALKFVPFPITITEILAQSQEKNTEVVVIIIASTIIVLLVVIGLLVFARECYRRKRSQTFDLTNTPQVHLRMEDFTLTRIPRTGAWYSDEGVTIQRFSETNGNSIVKSSNGVRKQPAISCISDMLREKDHHHHHSGSGAHMRQFSYSILPSDRKDSTDTTVSTASDGNFRHSTDSLVNRQNSNMRGAVNPIYLGDEYPRLLPSSGHSDQYLGQQSDFVNGHRENRALRRK